MKSLWQDHSLKPEIKESGFQAGGLSEKDHAARPPVIPFPLH